MATYYSNDFRAGLKIMLDGEPYAVEASEFVKPGKGQAFARVKLRRLLTGTRVEKTFKSTDSAEGADVVDKYIGKHKCIDKCKYLSQHKRIN